MSEPHDADRLKALEAKIAALKKPGDFRAISNSSHWKEYEKCARVRA
jgi:hypothetical protein